MYKTERVIKELNFLWFLKLKVLNCINLNLSYLSQKNKLKKN